MAAEPDRAPARVAKDGPIVLIGPGRAGSTLLVRLLGLHPDLGWWSGVNDRQPHRPWLSAVHRVWSAPQADLLASRVPRWPHPGETYGVWNHVFPDFSNANHDWGPEMISERQVHRLGDLVAATVRAQGASRFLTKITGWPRIDFLRTALPGCSLVLVNRTPEAVVASYRRQGWWQRNKPGLIESMTDDEVWRFYAGRYTEHMAALGNGATTPDHTVDFEQLVAEPGATVRGLAADLGLRHSARFVRRLERSTVDPASADRWRRELTPDAQRRLSDALAHS